MAPRAIGWVFPAQVGRKARPFLCRKPVTILGALLLAFAVLLLAYGLIVA